MFRNRTFCYTLIAFWLVQALPQESMADFVYGDFSSTAGLNLVGDASQVGSLVRRTPATRRQQGTMWSVASEDASNSFSTTFQFRISNLGGSTDENGINGGDGIAFNYSDIGNTFVTSETPDEFSVRFDTYDNGLSDASSNAVRLLFLG